MLALNVSETARMGTHTNQARGVLAGALRNERGGVAIAAAFALPVLLMLGGGAVDLHQRDQAQKHLQNALDAAVLGGAAASPSGSVDAARATYLANAAPGSPPATFTAVRGEVSGSASGSVPTSFLTMIGVGRLPINGQALAVTGTTTPCILLLEPTDSGLGVDNGGELSAPTCGIHVNSGNAQAVRLNGGIIRAESLCVRGGAYKNPSGQFIPPPRTGCAALNDPLASLPEPNIPGTCTDRTAGTGQTITLEPNQCYRNVTANSGGRIVFPAGNYRITGEVTGHSNATISGSGVMLYLNGANAKVTANSDVTFNLSAPTTGAYAGIALFQTRTSSAASAQGLVVNSRVGGKIEGVVYMPHTRFVLNSDVGLNASYTIFIGDTLQLNGASKLSIRDDYDGPLPLPSALLSVRLEE
jgi:type II secretory pathway pseudopilin PulG